MGEKLDRKALEAAVEWFDANFNGLPDSPALASGLISSYLAALPQAEPVADESIDYHAYRVAHIAPPTRASPTPAVSREVTEEMMERLRADMARSIGSVLNLAYMNKASEEQNAEALHSIVRAVMANLTAALSSEPHHG